MDVFGLRVFFELFSYTATWVHVYTLHNVEWPWHADPRQPALWVWKNTHTHLKNQKTSKPPWEAENCHWSTNQSIHRLCLSHWVSVKCLGICHCNLEFSLKLVLCTCNTGIHISVPVGVLAALLRPLLSANAPGKSRERCSSVYDPATMWEMWWNSRFLTFTWLNPDHFGHLGSEPMVERSISFSLPLPLSLPFLPSCPPSFLTLSLCVSDKYIKNNNNNKNFCSKSSIGNIKMVLYLPAVKYIICF